MRQTWNKMSVENDLCGNFEYKTFMIDALENAIIPRHMYNDEMCLFQPTSKKEKPKDPIIMHIHKMQISFG